MTDRTEVHVVCPHGPIATFTESSIKGVWIVNVRGGAEKINGDTDTQRWRHPMRCARCGLSVPINNMDLFGTILDRLVHVVDSPAVNRVSPQVVEVSLKLMADAAGAARALPE